MKLRELQIQIARALAGHGISENLNATDLTLAAELLVAKRRIEAASWLPHTSRILGSEFARRFAAHAIHHRPSCRHHPRTDAAAFASMIAADRGLPRRTRDVAAFEEAQARAGAPGPLFITQRLQIDGTQRDDTLSGIHLWWRWNRRSHLRYVHLPWGR
jgi:predicted nucleic acid-binding protein